MHYWLGLASWYRRMRPVLFALAVALPVSALAGFTVAGRQVAAQIEAPGAWEKLQAASRAPDAAAVSRLTTLHDRLRTTFLALLGLALLVPIVRSVRRAAGAKVEVTYRGGPVVRVPSGPTLLEISRISDVPHASVCGGRARCSTCRVGVESGLADLLPPSSAEAMTLASIMAPPHVRLACQIRPHEAITVTRLVAPPSSAAARGRPAGHPQGIERNLAVLFLDIRGFTRISENRLPYDVVFILNRLFAEVGEAIERHHGAIDKYLGDGLMAIFGARDGEAAGCRQALRAARDIDLGLDSLNREIASEIGMPLRIGMGIDVGPLVVGQIGHAGTASVTVIGNTVNAASRLEALTKEKGCQLIVAADVLAHAGLGLDAFPREDVDDQGLVRASLGGIDRARPRPTGYPGARAAAGRSSALPLSGLSRNATNSVGSPGTEEPTQTSNANSTAAGALELHLVETLEQGASVLVVASLTCVVGAKRHTAHAGQLLGRDLGILLALDLVPEALVGLAAVQLALGDRSRGGEHGKGNKGRCETFHSQVSLSSAASELPPLAVSRYGTATIKFQVPGKKVDGP